MNADNSTICSKPNLELPKSTEQIVKITRNDEESHDDSQSDKEDSDSDNYLEFDSNKGDHESSLDILD